MVATVFISHSCKDNEKAAPAGLTAEAAKARAQRLGFARKLRDTLNEKLKKDKRFKVFLDVRGGLKAGNVWREGLHNALRTCSAGVVLLTPESLDSRWVLKEATILSWRVFLGEPMVLIPIVLGISQEDLEQRGFGALDLDAIQWVRVPNADAAGLALAVKETVEALIAKISDPLADDEEMPATELWIRELAVCLKEVVDSPQPALTKQYLQGMCKELDIPPEDRLRFGDDPLVNIASHVLVAEENQILRFLLRAGDPKRPQRESLRDAVSSLWVDPTPASRLLARNKQVIVIDAMEMASAREYLVRALCNKVDWMRYAEVSDQTGGADVEVLDEIRKCVNDIAPIDSKGALEADIARNGPIYVILGPGSARASVLDSVTADYPGVKFIVAAGAKPQDKLDAWYKRAMVLYPLLQPRTREDAGARFRAKLSKFVKGKPQ
jgi:hypothetical protein